MAVPLALNIFNGTRLWLSKLESGSWTTQALIADGNTDPVVFPGHFTSGAVSLSQSGNLGIVIEYADFSGVRFYGNGTITPVDISAPAGSTYMLPQRSDGVGGVFTKTWGAFYRSGVYWLFLLKETISGLNTSRHLVCLRSADGGMTWNEEDSANAPLIYDDSLSIVSINGTTQNVYWDGVSQYFYVFASVIGASDTDHVYGQAFRFDVTANAGLGGWSAITDQFLADGSGAADTQRLYGSNFNVFSGGNMAGYVFPLVSGDLIAIYSTAFGHGTDFGGASNGIYVRIASGGTWGAATQLRATPSLLALTVFEPVSETCYVFEYFNGTTGEQPAPPTSFAGGVKVFTVDNAGSPSATLFTFPNPVGNSTANGYTDGMDRGTIFSGSMYVLYDDWNDDSNQVWAWDMSVPLNSGPGFVKLNLLPHPSAEAPSGPGFNNPPSCGGLFFGESSVTVQTLELTKIVVGGPALPGDWFLSAETGSPPTGISGAGHVGPSEVDAATYELNEVAFPGITFDSETGTWQDDNHTWGGDYEAGAWDCGDATMPTPTSVIVPPGGTVACTITNTFIPTPPPPPPPGPGNGVENPVGCWELLRIDVTLTPSKRLPVRGSVR